METAASILRPDTKVLFQEGCATVWGYIMLHQKLSY